MLRLSGSATALFEQQELWRSKIVRKGKTMPKLELSDAIVRHVNAELLAMDKHHIQLCFILDADYPFRLKTCTDAPVSFYYKGNANFNLSHMLAIVGTRNASDYGRNCVRKILSEIKEADVVTISGLAYGIDTEAHSRSVEFGIKTIAVMGCGLGTIYPHLNEPLSRRILEMGGTLISEYPYNTPPDRLNFPRRNRIIAGMSDAVLVAESAEKGGSMITAYIAQSYNRDVFAVPGSIFDDNHAGCHRLVRTNVAAMVTSGTELIEMMNWECQHPAVQTSLFVDLTENEEQVMEIIRSMREASIDVITESLPEFSPSKLAGILLGLELKGAVVCKPGKVYALNP
ncbi:MAG: DNA-processing protein DprA [Bacteroidales bacterium]|nr:DNA-processing protein DprA [Bacteroidales bacterium]